MDLIGIATQLPMFFTVIMTAVISAANPCAIGTMVIMMSAILVSGKSLKQLVLLGCIFITAVFSAYLLMGIVLLHFFSNIPLYVMEYVSLSVAALIIIVGIFEIKDFFWYGEGLSLSVPSRLSKTLSYIASKSTTYTGVFTLGIFVAAIELPCTGAPYLAVTTLISRSFDIYGFLFLIIYNAVFITPLLVILALVASGVRLNDVKVWKEHNKTNIRLLAGIFLVILGWLLVFTANGIINLG